MKNSVDPDQLASLEASYSGSTLFSKEGSKFLGSNVHSSYFYLEVPCFENRGKYFLQLN